MEKVSALTNFEYGEGTEAFKSCSVQFQGQLFIFGGFYEKRQISRIEPDCKMRRIGSLPFDFEGGTCNAFSTKLILCFPLERASGKSCWISYNANNFKRMKATQYPHWYGEIGSYKENPVAIAGNTGLEVEMHSRASWRQMPSIPAQHKKLYSFSTTTVKNVLYIFGGDNGYGSITEGWAFNGAWSRLTPLFQSRSGHRSIIMGEKLYHLGGVGHKRRDAFEERHFEEWTKRPGEMRPYKQYDRRQIESTLNGCNYPETFIVDNRYCSLLGNTSLIWNY